MATCATAEENAPRFDHQGSRSSTPRDRQHTARTGQLWSSYLLARMARSDLLEGSRWLTLSGSRRTRSTSQRNVRTRLNPIAGESLLVWLREKAKPQALLTEPDAEDWGWYSYVDWDGRQYLLGASASDDGGEREWILQIEKQRSIKEKILGAKR